MARTEKPHKRSPSLRDFDYFSNSGDHPDALSGLDGPGDRLGEGQDLPPASRKSPDEQGGPVPARQFVSLLLTALFVCFAAWFGWQFRDYASYAFADAQDPLLLGNVTEMTPESIPHNAYVSLHGITEHRGLHAQSVRGLTLQHDNFWYFRLSGSRGVFIEVPPDAEAFGPNTEVTVQGRALDPDKDRLYAALLKSYEDTFATELRAHRRVIQVGLKPGVGRGRYQVALVALIALTGAFAFNGGRILWALVSRRKPGKSG